MNRLWRVLFWALAILVVALLKLGIALAIYVGFYDLGKLPKYKEFVPKHLRKEWESKLVKSVMMEYLGNIIAPFACMFVVTEYRTDRVKRRNKQTLKMKRQYLIPKLRWLQTHDNAVDEWFWGMFAKEGDFGFEWTEEDYLEKSLSGKFRRWYSRWMWVKRNMAYGYLYDDLGLPKEDKPLYVLDEGYDNKPGGYLRIEVYKNYFRHEHQKDNGDGAYTKTQIGRKHNRSAEISHVTGVVNAMFANKFIDFNTSEYEE